MHQEVGFEEMIKTFDSNFTLLTVQLLINIQTISRAASEHHLSYLLNRLDPNEFYAKLMERNPDIVERATLMMEEGREGAEGEQHPPPPPHEGRPPGAGAITAPVSKPVSKPAAVKPKEISRKPLASSST